MPENEKRKHRLVIFSPQMGFMLQLGGGRYDYEQLHHLAARGQTIHVVAPLRNRPLSVEPPGVHCTWFRGRGIRSRISWTIPFLVPSILACWKARPDIVRIHNPYYLALLGLILKALFRTPVVGTILHFEEGDRFTRWIDRRIIPRFDGVLFISEATRSHFTTLHPNYRGVTATIYPGVPECRDTVEVDTAVNGEQHLPESFFLYVGSLIPRKNVAWLIEIFYRYRERGGSAELVIAGTGIEQPRLISLADSLGISPVVHFKSQVSENHKRLLYRRALCLLFPSKVEGFGFVAVEAMKEGTPCIVSDRGSLPEIVSNDSTGYVRSLEDEEGWLDAMHTLTVNKEKRNSFGEAAARLVSRRFSWEDSIKKTERFLSNVLINHRDKRGSNR